MFIYNYMSNKHHESTQGYVNRIMPHLLSKEDLSTLYFPKCIQSWLMVWYNILRTDKGIVFF